MTPAPPVPAIDARLRALLQLTLTPGLGPVLIARLLETFGDPERVLGASAGDLERVRGIGRTRAESIARFAAADAARQVEAECVLASELGVRLVARGAPDYPPLLESIPDPPPLLYVRGALRPAREDRYPLAIVGSRRCTPYGVEQAERFAGAVAGAGLTIVSGGARGIDTAAHRAAVRAGGRTIAVLGCGLAHCYPPENADLFSRIAAEDRGAILSELPLRTAPEAENFPPRNRIISGLSLGVLVIEAGKGSGSLITARQAAEDHGREVLAVPGRVDSPASEGSNELIRMGGAGLVTRPADVIEALEAAARHLHGGTHASRYADPAREPGPAGADALDAAGPAPGGPGTLPISEPQARILGALVEPRTLDELARATSMPAHTLRAELTVLEIQRRVARDGPRFHASR